MPKHIMQRYLKSIFVSFGAYDRARSGGAREFLQRVMAPKWQAPNPKIQIMSKVHNYDESPWVHVELVGGQKFDFEPTHKNVGEIFDEVASHTQKVEMELLLNSKPLPELHVPEK